MEDDLGGRPMAVEDVAFRVVKDVDDAEKNEVDALEDDWRRMSVVGLVLSVIFVVKGIGLVVVVDVGCFSFFLRFSAIQIASISSRDSSGEGVVMVLFDIGIVPLVVQPLVIADRRCRGVGTWNVKM
jgi:hypothetical protein